MLPDTAVVLCQFVLLYFYNYNYVLTQSQNGDLSLVMTMNYEINVNILVKDLNMVQNGMKICHQIYTQNSYTFM